MGGVVPTNTALWELHVRITAVAPHYRTARLPAARAGFELCAFARRGGALRQALFIIPARRYTEPGGPAPDPGHGAPRGRRDRAPGPHAGVLQRGDAALRRVK